MIWLRRVLRGLRYVLLSVIILLVTLVALVSAVVLTEPGSRWAINLVADRVPMLELGRLEGNLLTGLDVSYLDYRFEDQHYRVEGLAFRWQPLSLFYNTVSIQSLRADSVLLVLPVGEEEDDAEQPGDIQWPNLGLPVRIELGRGMLRNIRIQHGDTVTELEQLSGSISYGTFNARVYDLSVVAADYQVTVGGRLGLRFPYPSELDVEWRYQLPPTDTRDALALAGSGTLTGDIEQLDVSHQLTAPVSLETRAQITPHLSEPERNPYLVLDNNWQEQSPPADLWTFDQPLPVTSARLQLEGWLDDYRVQLTGEAHAEDLPSVQIALDGQGDLAQIAFDSFELEVQGVTLEASGQLAWAAPATEHAFNWDLALTVDGFNTALLQEEWPGVVNLSGDTRGYLGDEGLVAQVQNFVLLGLLRGLELRGSGEVSYGAGRVETDNLNLSLGANQLNLHGYLADTFDLRWHLAAPILGQIDPALGGSLEARGQLEGSLERPHLLLTVNAEQLRWQEYSVAELALALDRDAAGVYQLNGRANDLQLDQQLVQEAVIQGAGTLERHQVGLELASETLGTMELTLAGSYDDQQWRGNFQDLQLRVPALPRWQLLRSETMVISPEGFDLGAQCLTTRTGRGWRSVSDSDDGFPDSTPFEGEETPALCFEGQWQPEAGFHFEADIHAVPLRILRFWIKPEATLHGVIEGRVEARQTPADGLTASARLSTRDGEFRYRYAEEDLDIYAWRSAELRADYSGESLLANFATDWGNYGNASAELKMNTASGALDGSLRASFGDLAPLEALVPRLHEIGGVLSVDLRLQGTLEQPVVLGEVNLRDATAKLPELGLHFENVVFNIESGANGRLTATGNIDSGKGNLAIQADMLRVGQPDWQFSASLKGENFQIIQDRQLSAEISPAINVRANPQEIRIEGRAVIPRGRANIKTLPATATRLSDDVVIVNGRDNGNGVMLGIPWYLNVRLELGDDVRFEGFGLESRLSGNMVLLRTPARGLLTTGEVGVAEGVYRAYGQELKIERGRLIFQGPYDNPGLDIRAERTITNIVPEVTVGLEIGGTLQRPRSRIFSTPAQTDSDAMAMLLTGRPLSGTSTADANMLVNAIGTLGLERSNFITAEIAQVFRLDEFTVQTGDHYEESSLYIGKYLTPRLFVRYVVGLFDQANRMGLRYQLTESLRLEAESGTNQSVDMIYKFER